MKNSPGLNAQFHVEALEVISLFFGKDITQADLDACVPHLYDLKALMDSLLERYEGEVISYTLPDPNRPLWATLTLKHAVMRHFVRVGFRTSTTGKTYLACIEFHKSSSSEEAFYGLARTGPDRPVRLMIGSVQVLEPVDILMAQFLQRHMTIEKKGFKS